jgi:hypothetical protein
VQNILGLPTLIFARAASKNQVSGFLMSGRAAFAANFWPALTSLSLTPET